MHIVLTRENIVDIIVKIVVETNHYAPNGAISCTNIIGPLCPLVDERPEFNKSPVTVMQEIADIIQNAVDVRLPASAINDPDVHEFARQIGEITSLDTREIDTNPYLLEVISQRCDNIPMLPATVRGLQANGLPKSILWRIAASIVFVNFLMEYTLAETNSRLSDDPDQWAIV